MPRNSQNVEVPDSLLACLQSWIDDELSDCGPDRDRRTDLSNFYDRLEAAKQDMEHP